MNYLPYLSDSVKRAAFKFYAGCVLCALSIFSLIQIGLILNNWIFQFPNGEFLVLLTMAIVLLISIGLMYRIFVSPKIPITLQKPNPIQKPVNYLLYNSALPFLSGFVNGLLTSRDGSEVHLIQKKANPLESRLMSRQFWQFSKR